MDDKFDKELEGLTGRSTVFLLGLINPNGDELPNGVEDEVVSKRKFEIRHFLGAFRGLGRTLDSLSGEEAKVLDTLVGMDDFSAKFTAYLPSTAVSSTDTCQKYSLYSIIRPSLSMGRQSTFSWVLG
ncbi:expressed unknown protein [Seminavis robusta]|uniref:Uncharacterized protein n=1 Tax=Seminavis robusta TaxID=568900 RepID=A0A9N8EKN9_9STRA|nr:expressed unknown protein [Seminavis robusta]|eukprot:Sro1348_g264980.1 n/a (127) ;mRNA; f:3930-4310